MAHKRIEAARDLRQQEVPAEQRLWRALRNRALAGFKFRRQHPIGPYVADFACIETKVIVETDGESHLARRMEDDERTRYLESQGWIVLRYWNTSIYEELDAVKEAIYRACMERLTALKKSRETENAASPLSPGTPGERGRG